MPAPALDVSSVTTAFAPAFAVGFAIQHLNELLSALPFPDSSKKTIMGALSLTFGLAAAITLNISVLTPLMPGAQVNGFMNNMVTALVISTGTEGINSIVKFLGYTKDQKKPAGQKPAGH